MVSDTIQEEVRLHLNNNIYIIKSNHKEPTPTIKPKSPCQTETMNEQISDSNCPEYTPIKNKILEKTKTDDFKKQFQDFKKQFQKQLLQQRISKRRYDCITSLEQLFEIAERKLLIFPAKREFELFFEIIHAINYQYPDIIDSDILEKVRKLKDKPTDEVKEVIAVGFKRMGGGHWNRFLGELYYEEVNVQRREIDQREVEYKKDILRIVPAVLTHFEEKVINAGYQLDFLDYYCKILRKLELDPLADLVENVGRKRKKHFSRDSCM